MVFEVFRRNQKQMLVALTCLAMFAFILGGLLDRLLFRSQAGGNPVVATMWGKNVTAEQLNQFREGRRLVNTFFDLGRHEVGLPPRMPLGLRDDQVLNDMLLLGKAERMGIVVDDSEVTQFLNQQFEKKLDAKKFADITSGRASLEQGEDSGRRGRDNFNISEQQLYSLLAREIKINRVQEAIFPATVLAPPYRTWESQEPAFTKVQLELVRMPLEKYVDPNAKPDEAALKSIYEKYKSQLASPSQEQPGFLIPRKIDAQYLEGDVDKLLAQVNATDDEVKSYYESHKSDFRVEETVVPLPTGRSLPPPPTSPGASTPLPPPVSDGPKPITPKSEPAKKDESKSKPAPVEKKTPDSKNAKKTSFLPTLRGWAASVAMTGTWIQTPQDSKSAAKPSEPKKAAENKPSDATKVAPTPQAPTKMEDVKPAERFKPLSEVKDEVAKRVKREKARKLIVERMDDILRKTMYPYLDTYESQLRKFRNASPGSDKPVDLKDFKAPPAPDLAKIAAENGFTLKTTGLVDFDAASKLPKLGTAVRTGAGSGASLDDDRFAQFVFRQDLYRARIVRDVEDLSYFLYWKIRDEPEKAASFDEVKDQVIRIWREEQAIPKAKEAADKLAAAAQKASGDLSKIITKDSGLSIFTTSEFTKASRRLQTSDVFSSGRLYANDVPGAPNAGMEFLNEVFKMKVGEIKVIPDQAKRIYYVVKVKKRVDADFDGFVARYNFDQLMERSGRGPTLQEEYGAALSGIGAGLVRESGFKNRIPELTGNRGGAEQPDETE